MAGIELRHSRYPFCRRILDS